MFQERKWNWGWSTIVGLAVVAVVLVQAIRVNRPREAALSDQPAMYTQKGPLVSGKISIPGGEFYQMRLNLNRRAKLAGSFRTQSIHDRVAAAVIGEGDVEAWKAGGELKTFSKMGYVPGGRLGIILEPGVYLLLIDNRDNQSVQVVDVDFQLE